MAIYWVLAAFLNKRRDATTNGVDPEQVENGNGDEEGLEMFADRTDFQQKNFKYIT